MSKNVAESLANLHAEAVKLGLSPNLVSNYFTAVASQQGAAGLPDDDKVVSSPQKKTTTVTQFVKMVYPDLRPELLVALCRFYGEFFPNEDVVSRMVMDGRFFWDVEKVAAEPVTGSFVVHAGRRAGSSTLCRLVAAYEVIRRLEKLERGEEKGPFNIMIWVSNINAKSNKAETVRQVGEWVKAFDPRISLDQGNGTVTMSVRFGLPNLMQEISLVVNSYDPSPNTMGSYTKPYYSLFISDADVTECAEFIGDKCRSFEVFTSKFKPHARGSNTLQVYTDLYAKGLALSTSIFGDPYNTLAENQKNFNLRAEVGPIRL